MSPSVAKNFVGFREFGGINLESNVHTMGFVPIVRFLGISVEHAKFVVTKIYVDANCGHMS